jgi:AcrR family transcriptional regulator
MAYLRDGIAAVLLRRSRRFLQVRFLELRECLLLSRGPRVLGGYRPADLVDDVRAHIQTSLTSSRDPHYRLMAGLRVLLRRFHIGDSITYMKVEVPRRQYRMGRRAEAATHTAERVLDAAAAIFWERPTDQISLDEIAKRAHVSVLTIIRRFGSKEGVFAAAAERGAERIRRQRGAAVPGDFAGAVGILIEHYEELGDAVLRLLAEEGRNATLDAIVERGREQHAEWCARIFAPALSPLRGAARKRRLAQLIALCDVYVWKILRRDRGLGRAEAARAMIELLEPLME